jgi:hypothetical protein
VTLINAFRNSDLGAFTERIRFDCKDAQVRSVNVHSFALHPDGQSVRCLRNQRSLRLRFRARIEESSKSDAMGEKSSEWNGFCTGTEKEIFEND